MDVIETRNLSKKYPDGTVALRGISLRLGRKNSVILGHNGAGKTTLLRMLSTQLLPTSGKASVLGYDIATQAGEIRKRIVSIPQETDAIDALTPAEHLEIYFAARGFDSGRTKAAIESSLKAVGLYEARDKTANLLSGGMKRKIFVAMALASDAELVFLDEPTTGLDPISRLEVWSAIKKLRGNIVLTTHYLEEAKFLADEIVLIHSGRVAMQGSMANLLRPFRKLMRVDGLRIGALSFRIGGTDISYIKSVEALRYSEKGYDVRQLDLEDLFILGVSR